MKRKLLTLFKVAVEKYSVIIIGNNLRIKSADGHSEFKMPISNIRTTGRCL